MQNRKTNQVNWQSQQDAQHDQSQSDNDHYTSDLDEKYIVNQITEADKQLENERDAKKHECHRQWAHKREEMLERIREDMQGKRSAPRHH